MPRRPDHNLKVARRRQQIGELVLQGMPQLAIADELGVSQATVCRDIKALHKEWQQSGIRNFDQAAAVELKKLERLERMAWEAWERSRQPLESTTVHQDGGGKRARKTVKQQIGDPRFLELVQKCIAARRQLLGLDSPSKLSFTSPDGEQPYHTHVMAELMRLAEETQGGPVVIDGDYIQRQLADPAGVPASESSESGDNHNDK